MQETNKTVIAQIISGILKFLLAVFILVALVFAIPLFLSITKGKDISPVDDSSLQLQTINIPEAENAFYDLDKIYNSINTKNIPKGKELVSNYLEIDQWDQKVVKQILDDNQVALQDFTLAAAKGKFQLPYTADSSKISNQIPVTPVNEWREISRLSGVKAIYLAKRGQDKEALNEAFKSIIIGDSIENSQGPLIFNLVSISIKDTGLNVLQKVISIIPKDSIALLEYKSKLEKYQATGNKAPFSVEYLICKQSWDNLEQYDNVGMKILAKNKFYFKKNLSNSYCFYFFNQLTTEYNKNCSEVKEVKISSTLLERDNLLKMYVTENVVGKYFAGLRTNNEMAYNNVVTKKCMTEDKLKETILLLNNKK